MVILIILLVSAVACHGAPGDRPPSGERGGRVVQGALARSRDAAIHNNSLSGIRLLPDPAFPLQYTTVNQISPTNILAANRVIPIQPGPNYSEGLINITSPSSDQTNGTPQVQYPLGGGPYPYPFPRLAGQRPDGRAARLPRIRGRQPCQTRRPHGSGISASVTRSR